MPRCCEGIMKKSLLLEMNECAYEVKEEKENCIHYRSNPITLLHSRFKFDQRTIGVLVLPRASLIIQLELP